MGAYFHFMHDHAIALFRCFFALGMAIDLVFIYAIVFDRDLPRRMAERFFGTLFGMPLALRPSNDEIPVFAWIGFIFISAFIPFAWVLFELYLVPWAG